MKINMCRLMMIRKLVTSWSPVPQCMEQTVLKPVSTVGHPQLYLSHQSNGINHTNATPNPRTRIWEKVNEIMTHCKEEKEHCRHIQQQAFIKQPYMHQMRRMMDWWSDKVWEVARLRKTLILIQEWSEYSCHYDERNCDLTRYTITQNFCLTF